MSQVATVRGLVDVEDLGPTLMHEHVFVLSTEHLENYGIGATWDEDAEVEEAVTKLTSLANKGITTIVDPTVIGLGRYIPRVQKIAERVDLHIIVASGLYTYGDLPFVYQNRGPGTMLGGDEPMVEDFVKDIEVGIADTGVKAAMLKCAVEHAEMSAGVERALRAVAKTHVRTGTPVTVHTSAAAQSGRGVVQILKEEGVNLAKVVIGHAGDSTDLDYLMELADTGATLGMDRFGLDIFCPTQDRVNTIASLVERGYADRIVLSHDASCFIDWFGPDFKAISKNFTPNWNYEHISDDVLPMLREAGVSEGDVDQMLVATPQRIFS